MANLTKVLNDNNSTNDAEFDKLLLWQDLNSNGISQKDELIKLSDKVQSINLNYENVNFINL